MRKFSILIAAMACMVAQPAMAQDIGRINNVTSGVQVVRGNTTIPARSGLRLRKGDIIRTGRRGRVGITLSDDSRLALGTNSEIVLSEYEFNRRRQTGRSVTRVNRGSLGVRSGNISRTGSRRSMRVRTPTSTLGVRGTTFVVEVAQ